MKPTTDNRFDPNSAAKLLLDIGNEHSVDLLVHKLVSRAVNERQNLACVQVWLVDKGDLCSSCPHKARCPDQSRCLHLKAGEVRFPPGFEATSLQLKDSGARNPLGVGVVGRVAADGKQIVLQDEELEADSELAWLRKLGVCGVSGSPISFKGEILGVAAAYAQEKIADEALPWGLIFANHIGAAIANARAFEEIQRLKAQLEMQNAYLQEEAVEARAFGSLVGQNAALRQIISQIDLVAPTEASVIILGETGTGKELVAHEIHRRSARKDGPLVRVNCSSIPKELFESEFFGHVKGAFTGAIKGRPGHFETAEAGTIFLDAIGEVPLEIQSKLLRVLQEKRYERVGEDRSRQANVRVVAATNRDLKKAVAAGRFREDLYYRLHVFPIQVLPLRERSDDIPLLAKHFIDLSVRELKCVKPRLTRAGVAKLQSYYWPGNVRELRNVIERAVILARGGTLEFDLPVATHAFDAQRASSGPAAPEGSGAQPEVLTEVELRLRERDNLLLALKRSNWKLKGPDGAAEMVGVKPTTLLARMKKWGIMKPAAETPA